MTISSFEILFYTITFLLPGYIIRAIREFLFPNRVSRLKHLAFLRLLMYGAANFIVAMVFFSDAVMVGIQPLSDGETATSVALGTFILSDNNLYRWGFVVFLQPAILGVAWAVAIQSEGLIRLANIFGFRPDLDDPSAWDFKFRRSGDGTFVIVTLLDGTEIFGDFGMNSYASSSPDERDIFIEEIRKSDWSRFDEPSGIWISGEDVKRIEFFWPKSQPRTSWFKRICQKCRVWLFFGRSVSGAKENDHEQDPNDTDKPSSNLCAAP